MADATRSAWAYYLGLIEDQHGMRRVADLERSHCYRIRDGMADEPGKANNYMAKFKALLEFGAERGWIKVNPAAGIALLETGEHEPWPAHVLREALAAASPMLRLAIVTGLCSGQRISDAIVMQHGWHDGHDDACAARRPTPARSSRCTPYGWPRSPPSSEGGDPALRPRGKPFRDTDRIQAQLGG
jgi:hypothetical protein